MHTFPNNKKYIGITCRTTISRWGNNGDKYKGQLVYKAIQKYGWENIKHEILFDNLSKDEACKIEQELILKYHTYVKDKLCNGYNVSLGGESGAYGVIRSVKTRQKISTSKYHKSKRRKIDCFDLNGIFIKTYNDLVDASLELGIEKTNIVKCCRKKSEYIGGRICRYNDETHGENSEAYVKKMPINTKVVSKYTINGEFIKTYHSLNEAAKEHNCDPSNIANCANGTYVTSHGFIWLFGTKDENGDVSPRLDISKKKKKICAYDLDNNLCAIFESIMDAKRWVGKPNGANINAVLAGRRNKAYGYIWRYAD